MKLLLTSAGLRNASIVEALKSLCKIEFSDLNLAYVPTGANLDTGDKRWIIKDLVKVSELEFKQIDIVDIAALPEEIFIERLENADVLYFSGGNTYYLMYWFKKSKLQNRFSELIKNKVYIGESASSLVVGPTITLSSDKKKESFLKRFKTISDEGLKLVNFSVKSHINSKHFPDRSFEYVEELAKKTKETVYALDDTSAVVVDGEKIRIVSEGEWKKFN